ncbi:MAG: peptide chain release factor N(5)-glutamine methyltransferase [Candidatus Tectomicrobia bacterium]|uniref:Release factor glutamine methyltransferase n=1 Tax=Tectimicrobiota bacterium TaxID=2528274 RepID=A0A933GK68_UNCTE|nr:peptide chain release factor N(5)-glutamine methyltransferase [Candidatus Tectomicrobia bacterium]
MEWTIGKILQWGESYLKKYSPTPRLDMEIILAHTLLIKRIALYLDYFRPLTKDELERLRGFVKRRAQFEPVAYITGIKEFWSMDFQVNKSTLIPRPETELIVERAIQIVKKKEKENGACGRILNKGERLRILDLGTGCGNLAIALAKEFPFSLVIAMDFCPEALLMARENARNLVGERPISFIRGSFFQPLRLKDVSKPFHLVVSNPPYIPHEEMVNLPLNVKNFEPIQSLDGGPEGMDCIREIIEKAHLVLKADSHLVVEIGLNQAGRVADIIAESRHWKNLEFIKDHQGIDRVFSVAKQGVGNGSDGYCRGYQAKRGGGNQRG